MEKIRVGFALTGSFCTFSKAMEQFDAMIEEGWDVTPIMSDHAYSMDTRFGKAEDFIRHMEETSGHSVIHTITEAEPIGPQKMFDVLVVAPCTGNTMGKVANGINDTPVTMAIKSHIRNSRPVVLAVSTNDALAAAAKHIGALLNQRNLYFVPMRQDAPNAKPRSVVADFEDLIPTVRAALDGEQVQPILK